MSIKIPLPVAIFTAFTVAAIALLALLSAVGVIAAQGDPHTYPADLPMVAVYPNCNTENDPNSFWALPLTVDWDDASYYVLPDGRFVVTGSAIELPGATLVFVSNGENNHGSASWISYSRAGG